MLTTLYSPLTLLLNVVAASHGLLVDFTKLSVQCAKQLCRILCVLHATKLGTILTIPCADSAPLDSTSSRTLELCHYLRPPLFSVQNPLTDETVNKRVDHQCIKKQKAVDNCALTNWEWKQPTQRPAYQLLLLDGAILITFGAKSNIH